MEIILEIIAIIGFIISLYQLPFIVNFITEIYCSLLVILGKQPLNPCLAASTAILKAVANRKIKNLHTVRHIENSIELKSLHKLDMSAYGDADIGYTCFESWWLSHKTGLFAMFDSNDKIIGAVGIWPITKEFYRKMSSGDTTEKQLTPQTILQGNMRPSSYWYISGIVLKNKFRGHILAAELIRETILQWCFEQKMRYPVKILATAYSKSGMDLLRKLDFTQIIPSEKAQDGFAIYSRNFRHSELKYIIDSLK
jgi:hypothetical protein